MLVFPEHGLRCHFVFIAEAAPHTHLCLEFMIDWWKGRKGVWMTERGEDGASDVATFSVVRSD